MSRAVQSRGCTAWVSRLVVVFCILLLLCIIHSFTFYNNGRNQPHVDRLGFLGTCSAAPHWISVPNYINYTSTLLSRWRSPALRHCQSSRTASISIPGLDDAKSPIELPLGVIHEFVIVTFDEFNQPRCSGGDYFELDLTGDYWKSRPPVVDHGDGSYTFRMQVDRTFAGTYDFVVTLIYRNFDGLLKWEDKLFTSWRERKMTPELRKISIKFYDDGITSLPKIEQCRKKDFDQDVWSGRWTRHAKNDTCDIDDSGRYRCLDPNIPCPGPWCDGPLASLESNGWVYSTHCSFKIYTQDSAWKCLANKWLFFWGDSNHVDTIRNLLNFVLGLPEITHIARSIDDKFVNPKTASVSVRITSIFNGHWNESMNYLGLQSLRNDDYRKLIWKFFKEERLPDAMILNSGLHDGKYWENIQKFTEGAEYAAEFWDEIMRHMKNRTVNNETAAAELPDLFYRSTIATAGNARERLHNPSKMEAYNGVLLEKLKEKGVITGGVIDAFDMTFPWHYDNRCSDGLHYGRPPEKKMWKDGQIGHQYFVDLMLCHVLLHAICNG